MKTLASGHSSLNNPHKRVRRESVPAEEIDDVLAQFECLSENILVRDATDRIDFVKTVRKIASHMPGHFNQTPLRNFPLLDHETGVKALIKLENIQRFADVAVRRFAAVLITTVLEQGFSGITPTPTSSSLLAKTPRSHCISKNSCFCLSISKPNLPLFCLPQTSTSTISLSSSTSSII
ncbi:hypothetical protein GEMRC1_012615 [Eukaryota sp. GEM-RC1]